jgi:hypothetical protein
LAAIASIVADEAVEQVTSLFMANNPLPPPNDMKLFCTAARSSVRSASSTRMPAWPRWTVMSWRLTTTLLLPPAISNGTSAPKVSSKLSSVWRSPSMTMPPGPPSADRRR